MANQLLYGFHTLKDAAALRVTEVGVTVVNTAIDETLAEHNRQLDRLMGLFVAPTTDFKITYKATGARRLQPLDEQGRARPTQVGALYEVAFPLQAAGDAFGQTFLARQYMTVQEVNDVIAAMMVGDLRWMRDHILGALFASGTWSFVDDLHGTLTIQPLANGDSVSYMIQAGTDAGATDTHQLAQANAIGAGADNPYPTIYNELNEHPENGGGPYIAFVSSSLIAATEALATFYQVQRPELAPGSGVTVLSDTLNVPVPGVVRGFESSGIWIVEWPVLPSGYIVAVSAGGDKPLGMRQHPIPALQGFNRVAERDDFPYYESQYQRHAGFGAWNRVGAVVMRIGNGTYAVPSNYGVPMG